MDVDAGWGLYGGNDWDWTDEDEGVEGDGDEGEGGEGEDGEGAQEGREGQVPMGSDDAYGAGKVDGSSVDSDTQGLGPTGGGRARGAGSRSRGRGIRPSAPRRPSWGALKMQGAKASVQTNLREDRRYFVSFPIAGYVSFLELVLIRPLHDLR